MVSAASPPWLFDAEDLRCILDRLRGTLVEAVSVPSSLPAASISLHHEERARIAQALKEVLERLAPIDLEAGGLLYSPGAAVGSREDARRLGDLLRSLQDAWKKHVLDKLGVEKAAALGQLLARPVPDLLGLLEKRSDENANSDVLAWLLNPKEARNIAPAALLGLVGVLDSADQWRTDISAAVSQRTVSVRREFVIGREWSPGDELDRIDIVVTGPGFVLAIENKIYAPEHDEQTMAYWRWLEGLTVRTGAIFLTPNGMPAACSAFRPVSYLQMLGSLLNAVVHGRVGPKEEGILASYAKALGAEVLRTEMQALLDMTGGNAREYA
jgi:hypothetical protein